RYWNQHSWHRRSYHKYKDIEPTVKMEEVDGEELVKKFAEEMEGMLGRKMKSVKRLAEAAEDADLYHEFNATLEFDYYNSMLINSVDKDGNAIELGGEFPLEENEHFNKLQVNTLQSDIQVPTNVYNKDPGILNGVYMSEALNDVFVDNFQKDPTLTWQYFGSAAGFFRLYPGIAWTPDENGVVTFDCRNRNWYIQAATSPKDIIIVVDVSGSMKGLRLTIAKHTINTILDTLGENDFVNVIAYSDYVQYVEPCFKGTLVQADLDNREHFKLLVEENPSKSSMRFAASLGQGSLCNQAIMLITDGAMEDYEEVFQEFNWPERRVRVFTYLIGREVTFADTVKWIACNNKGYYTHVSTLADVQENVMEYLHVLSRPMVINHDHDIIWTEAYMDSALFNTQAQSLLLMTSVAMPVFSKKKETLSHGILLGVVGTDVPLRELMRLAPRYKLGVHGYAFLNTNNGYILAHPALRPLYKEGKKLKPKPNYNSVDLAEVEWEDTDETLRTAMVKGETGTLSLDVRATVEKGRRVMFLKNDYFYTTINETPFSLGMVLTRGHGEYIFIGNVSVKEGKSSVLPEQQTLTYCETDIDPHHRKLTQLQAVFRYLTGKEPDLECDEKLLRQTLFDAVVTAPMEAYWTALMLNPSGMDEGVETAFLGTRSGLMRVSRYVGIEKRVAKKFLSPSDKENIFTMDHFPVWYRRAAEYPAGKFLYYIPKEDTRGRDYFLSAPPHTVGVCIQGVCIQGVCIQVYVSRVYVSRVYVSRVYVSRCMYPGCMYPGCMYPGVCIQGVCIQGVCIQGVCIQGVCIQGVCIQGVCIQGVCIQGVCIQGVCIHGVCIQGVCIQVYVSRVYVSRVYVSRVYVSRCMYPGCMYPGCMYPGCMYPGCMYPGVCIQGVCIQGVCIQGVCIQVYVSRVYVSRVYVSRVYVSRVSVSRVYVSRVYVSRVYVSRVYVQVTQQSERLYLRIVQCRPVALVIFLHVSLLSIAAHCTIISLNSRK
uniref:Calcium voltage-gated channel auxiliary subunit alpha2delta 4 n=1 Tax=Salmo trutta TaxID=8032 RepID=A0A674BA25_SALTR